MAAREICVWQARATKPNRRGSIALILCKRPKEPMNDTYQINSRLRYRSLIVPLTVWLFAVLLLCGLAWRLWIGPHYMLAAIDRGDASKVKLLVRLRVNPNADVFLQGGLMHCAAANGRTQIMEILQNAGGDVNRIDGYGVPPAEVAVYSGDLASLRWLLAHGANASIKDRNGNTITYYITNFVAEPQRENFFSAIKTTPPN